MHTKYRTLTNKELLRLRYDKATDPEWVEEMIARFEKLVDVVE